MPPVSLQKASRVLESYVAGGGEPEVWKLWIALPDGLDEALVARAFARAIREPHSARVVGRALNSAYLELFLAELARHPRWPETLAASCLDADSPKRRAQQLGELFRKLGQLGIDSLSASQRDERIRAFAEDLLFVEASRRIIVGKAEWEDRPSSLRWSFVAVLMEDASPASVDALLPQVESAVRDGGEELDRLRGVLRRQKSLEPTLQPLRTLLEQRASRREGHRRRELIAKAISLEPLPSELRFNFHAHAFRRAQGRAEVRGDFASPLYVRLKVDFDAEPFFDVRVEQGRRSSHFRSDGAPSNGLGLDAPFDLADWPGWFARVRRRVRHVTWEQTLSCNLRGKNRDRLRHWLEGTSGRPAGTHRRVRAK